MVLLAAILGCAAFAWAMVLAVRGSVLTGVLLSLVAICCCGPYLLKFEVGGINLSLDRLLLVGVCGAAVLQWRLGLIKLKPLCAFDYPVFALIGVLVASIAIFGPPPPSKITEPVVQHLINGYLIPLALYLLVRQVDFDDLSLDHIQTFLGWFGLYLAVTGIAEAFQQWWLVYPSYIADPNIGLHFGRARGPMIHSVSYGVYLGVCLISVWLTRERLTKWWQWLAWAGMPIMLAAIYFTKTRSVWFGALTGLVLAAAFAFRSSWRWWIIGGVAAAGVTLSLLKVDDLLKVQREGTVQDTVQSANMRASFAYVSWKMFLDRPIFGFGFGHFPKAKLAYLGDRETSLPLEQIRGYVHHNTLLSLLTETGLIGLAAYVAMLAAWGWAAWRLIDWPDATEAMRRQGLLMLGALGVIIWQQLGHEITFTPHDHAILFVVAGATVNLVAGLGSQEKQATRPKTADKREDAETKELELVATV